MKGDTPLSRGHCLLRNVPDVRGVSDLGETAALAVGFILIILLLYRKVHIGTTMFTASAVIGLLGGFGLRRTAGIIFTSVTSRSTIVLLAVVTMICILDHLLRTYKILDRMVDSLEDLFGSSRVLIMLVPSLMGVLFIPGGAVMSAPVVGYLGDRLEFGNARKSAINIVFRHALFLLFPFSTAMVLASQLAEVSPYMIIRLNIPVAAAALLAGYILFVRKSPVRVAVNVERSAKALPLRVGRVLLYTSPFWLAILLNLAFGTPFYLALAPGVLIVYMTTGEDKGDFARDIIKGINIKMLYSVAGIMSLQGFISNMPAVKQTINSLVDTGMDIRVLIVLAAAFIGFLTASNPAVVGMLCPIFLPFAHSLQERAAFASLIFISGFLFYFISPVHLCQVFTTEYFGVKSKELYREYRLYWPALFILTITLFFVVY
ncbi:MAG: hypothetical protein HPY66_1352 [Firmicutes bacterium]|nr:hypothetical protein [Bacillota bacterium]MDI6706853.1 DUF401 family protein [Bacillota bacterium]